MSNVKNFTSFSASQTQKWAGFIAKEILKNPARNQAKVIALTGDLGSGKTTFVQGLAAALGLKEKIVSPTFVLMKRFELSGKFKKQGFDNFYHFDCYRLDKPADILALGWSEIIAVSANIVAVEWAEKIQSVIPPEAIWLEFQHLNKNSRKIQTF